jgi:hypothetical protein
MANIRIQILSLVLQYKNVAGQKQSATECRSHIANIPASAESEKPPFLAKRLLYRLQNQKAGTTVSKKKKKKKKFGTYKTSVALMSRVSPKFCDVMCK